MVLNDPGALTEIVENQTELDEGPAEIDILLPNVAHVRVERFGTRGGEKNTAENHEAELVGRTDENLDRIERVESFQDCGKRENMNCTGQTEK